MKTKILKTMTNVTIINVRQVIRNTSTNFGTFCNVRVIILGCVNISEKSNPKKTQQALRIN